MVFTASYVIPHKNKNPPPLSENKITHYAHKKQNMIRWGLYRETYVVLVSPEETELHLGTYFFLLPPINLCVCCFPQIREANFFFFLFFIFQNIASIIFVSTFNVMQI